MKSLLVVLMSVFLVSCSSKSALQYFDKSDLEARAFQESKKGDYIENNSPKVILWALYLNNIDNTKYNDAEYFLISLYTSNNKAQSLKQLDYKIKLNDTELTEFKVLDSNDKLSKLLPRNVWGEYYLVKFNKLKNDNLKLNLLQNDKELIDLSFLKAL